MVVKRLTTRTVLALGVIVLLLPLVSVQAYDWSGASINSGYAVTTDWHGEMVPIGETVTAWAGTTDLTIVKVAFRWLRPGGTEAWPPVEATDYNDVEWDGLTVREFSSSEVPDELGDWGVQAVFYDDGGHGHGPVPNDDDAEKVAIRARSFFSVPEVPLGTITILIAMFGALGVLLAKKNIRPL